MENQLELVKAGKEGKDVTTSLMVAKVFGKDHRNVIRDIESLECSPEFRVLNFEHTPYVHPQNGQTYKMYEITRDGFSFLVMGYTGKKAAEFKEMFIKEFNRRENLLRDDDYIIQRSQEILAGRVKQLEASVHMQQEQLRLQERTIAEQAPMVEYCENVLQSRSLIATTIVAKELGMSAIELNKFLQSAGVIYEVQGTWVLNRRYQNQGYAGMKTYTYQDTMGYTRTSSRLYWTEKGRHFINTLLSNRRYNKKSN